MVKADTVSTCMARPYGALFEAAAAIGTDIVQYILHTVRAKGAFVATDARLGGSGRQILIAEFAVGS